jgi:hypothetical protein
MQRSKASGLNRLLMKIKCSLCGYEYAEECGAYGCPNCFMETELGEQKDEATEGSDN